MEVWLLRADELVSLESRFGLSSLCGSCFTPGRDLDYTSIAFVNLDIFRCVAVINIQNFAVIIISVEQFCVISEEIVAWTYVILFFVLIVN